MKQKENTFASCPYKLCVIYKTQLQSICDPQLCYLAQKHNAKLLKTNELSNDMSPDATDKSCKNITFLSKLFLTDRCKDCLELVS